MELANIYKQVFSKCARLVVYDQHDINKCVKEWLPWLGELTEELQRNAFGLAEQELSEIYGWWNQILTDLLEGMEQDDRVLLEDTVEFGLKEFLECFFDEDELCQLRKESQDE